MRRLLFLLSGLAPLVAAEPLPTDADRLAELTSAQAAWSHEGNPARRRELAETVINTAIGLYSDDQASESAMEQKKRDAIEEVAADGRLAGADLTIPDAKQQIALTELFSLPLSKEGPEPVIRRITPNRLEIWTPKHGWLFDARGHIVAEARPKRRDGTGREWFGAFLADGRWATTDLWERDDTLYIYSPNGKPIREVPTGKLLPLSGADADRARAGLIGWARSDKDGQGWVLSIGSEEGRGRVWIGPAGPPRILDELDPWKLCQPRQLGARGFYIGLSLPSDDLQQIFNRGEAGHGSWVGFPAYFVTAAAKNGGHSGAVIPNGNQFGFWPQSHRTYITAEDWSDETGPRINPQTWFFDANGNFECRVAARRVGDAPDNHAMLFATDDRRVFTLDPDFQFKNPARFTLHNHPLAPRELHPDLNLGIFADGQRLILASWHR